MSGETYAKGQYIYYGKAGGCIITGNEDGIKHVLWAYYIPFNISDIPYLHRQIAVGLVKLDQVPAMAILNGKTKRYIYSGNGIETQLLQLLLALSFLIIALKKLSPEWIHKSLAMIVFSILVISIIIEWDVWLIA